MRHIFIIVLFSFIYVQTLKAQASFTTPDTVCVNTPVNIVNTSAGASSYYWNFCVADIANTAPTGANLGNPNGVLSTPVFMDYVQVNNNYYGFVVNLNTNRLVRVDFGNSLLNTPTAVNLGDFGGVIPLNAEGIQVVFNEGKWYAIIVGGAQSISTSPRIVKIDFGANITNASPTATNWGNIGGLTYPHDLHIFKENNNWYGFTVNAEDNTITRFNFGTSFENTPTGINLGNIGNLAFPTGIFAINDNGFWRVFVLNAGNNTRQTGIFSLTRLDFGSSLLNSPTGVNLGNPGNLLQHPRDLTIMKMCNQTIGFAVNGHLNNSDILKFNFNNDLSKPPSVSSLGNVVNLNFPHSISKLFRVGSDLYSFITNATNNTITRLQFTGCTNSSIPNSTLQSPPAITYNTAGTYNINLTVDDGLPTQSAYCRNVVVMPELQHSPTKNLSICSGDSVLLTSNFISRNKWSSGTSDNSIYVQTDGTYWVETTNGACINRDSFVVTVKPAPFQVNLGKDTTICSSNALTLDAGNSGASYLWSNGVTSQTINVKDAGKYYVIVKLIGCVSTDTIQINVFPKPTIMLSNDTTVCRNSSLQLFGSGGVSYQWIPSSGMSNPSAQNPMITALTNTTYYVSVTNTNSCTNTDSVKVDIWPDPVYKINSPASICLNDSIQLKASGGVNYEWQPSTYLNDGSIENPMAFPQNTTTYSVQISDKCNNSKILSTTITVLLRPVVEISKSTDVDCVTPVAQLEAIGGVRYTWTPGTFINSTSIANPIVYPHNNTWYKVDAYNENGCKATDSVLVLSSYAGDGKFYIPNAFTPNGDGKNDCFGMKYLGEPEIFELSVFNRWGQKMYHTTNPSNCWNGLFNGTPQPAGVFIYILKVKSECTSGVLEKKGFVTLIR